MSNRKINYCNSDGESAGNYIEYINNHIRLVKESYIENINVFRIIFPDVYKNNKQEELLNNNIRCHDQSKFDGNEFTYYREKFFPVIGSDPKSEQIKKNFKIGWLHHIHNNAHHPAHWALVDNGTVEILDMPDIYIIEMLCDWMAMSKHFNSSTLDYWKSESAQKLPMSKRTKSKVNEFMHYMSKNNKRTLW